MTERLYGQFSFEQTRGDKLGMLGFLRAAYIAFVLCALAPISSPAQTFTTLANFNQTDGYNPEYMALVQGFDGNYYGTTENGGSGFAGTVFKITPGGTLTTIYNFCSKTGCSDGANPFSGLALATNGNLYGTTAGGGAHGDGTVFEITAGGTLTTLYSFCSQTGCTDGFYPVGALVQATNGNFYGTTSSGGANSHGTIFEITPGGTLTTLHSFDFSTDGAVPYAGLVQATNGNFYGTTTAGGADSHGTIFEITGTGALTTLYNFCSQTGCTDGGGAYAGLVQAANGNLYGTTDNDGAHNDGVVFEITPAGVFTPLHSFAGGSSDGNGPLSGLIQATDGNFYGTTTYGGANNDGTVFEITPSGAVTVLHSFDITDGETPYGGLVQASNGTFYGTTFQGGTSANCPGGCGTVFSLSVGLGSFVETLPASGKVGAAVVILGNTLTGTTSVTFNGTVARFAVVSSSEIRTTVPTGATTGKVRVKTPGGTLVSNVAFRVK
jgi:uncharacterized repeat protein (TIGR03803 family)